MHSLYAMPLMLEATLLLCFGLIGTNLETHRVLFVPVIVYLLCYVMGLQNAMIPRRRGARSVGFGASTPSTWFAMTPWSSIALRRRRHWLVGKQLNQHQINLNLCQSDHI